MNTERLGSNANQLREMNLGITSLESEYLHVLIFLHRGDSSCYNIRLNSARKALSLLPALVSNWASVYNGIIW